MEHIMLKARGVKQREIAAAIGKCERTVRNYLTQLPRERKKPVRKIKLDEYKPFIDGILTENPSYNGVKLLERIRKMGFTGHATIVKEYIAQVRKEENKKAVIRFETEPGHQAQVDWVEFGKQSVDGCEQKLYAFTMVLGYSRMPFVCFTTRMDSATLLYCHLLAFLYFGGIPEEILYDNMKTAWIFDGEKWQVNKQLARFAYHYSFIPKRCRIHRPETKGKVERFNKYLQDNFFLDYKDTDLTLDGLNEAVIQWIDTIKHNKLTQFNQSRNERFEEDKKQLKTVNTQSFDVRNTIAAVVNRESCIVYKTNSYSVPPEYIGRTLAVKTSVIGNNIEVFDADGKSIKTINCEKAGAHKKVMSPKDTEEIQKYWERGRRKDSLKRATAKKRIKPSVQTAVDTCNPSIYEQLISGGAK